ncbi:MAG: FmdB family zinc ribbon protein [Anaerolineae bacterium]
MPMYVYQCDKCGLTFERKQAVTEAPLCDCPECDGHVRRVIQPVGVVFKGSGWYVTDHRSKNATNGSPGKDHHKEDAAAGTGTDSAAGSGAADSESKAKEPSAT